MKQSELFVMIMGETLWNNLVALFIGIPVSLFLTELISLATSKLIGMGIIGHQFRISWVGLELTVFGFIMVQILIMLILSLKMNKKEPIDLLNEQKEKVQRILSPVRGLVSLLLGAVLLCIDYILAVLYLHSLDFIMFALILFMGISGTFMLFRGLGSLIGAWIKRKSSSFTGLFVFTGRQLQENVLHQWSSLAISSLLILMAMVCFAYGISSTLNQNTTSNKTVDFTFRGSEKEIVSILTSDKLKPYVKDYYAMKLGHLRISDAEMSEDTSSHTFFWTGLEELVSREKNSEERENLLRNLSYQSTPYLISFSSYNTLLKSINKAPIFYLGVMFLIIANTVLGLKFLMQQRSTRHRYSTVSILGASVESLCSSAKLQILWYFGLAILVALISSIFGIRSMLETFLVIPKTSSLKNSTITLAVAIALIAFIIFELCYIWMIQRKSDEEIKKLKEIG